MSKQEKLTNDPIASFLKTVKFKRKLFGGVDEKDVWKKIDELNELYKAELRAERARFNLLLKERTESISPHEKEGNETSL
ncbi:MAG: hypothetical protein HUJ54_05305 [Erysipelotrichaceae bacterium]|nr:hypothetical protein [Erysipelotrichaceae bacterium]